MRALVTGGAGFIGSHIVERLLKDGHSVVVLDNFFSGKPENLSFVSDDLVDWCHGDSSKSGGLAALCRGDFTLIRGDIRDYQACLQASRSVDAIFHQAALRSVPKSMKAPHDYNAVNIDGILNLLEAARENNVKRFVFASSSSIYGDPDEFPEREDFYPLLISPYALSKLAGEYYLRVFSKNYGLETVALRYFNVYGPRQALDDEYAVVVPKFIHCILNNEPPPIFGDGKQSRDFTHIDNIVEANLLAATASINKQLSAISHEPIKHFVFNIANGEDSTILTLVDILNKIIGKNIKPKFLPLRPGDVFKTHADISKAKNILGFNPKVSFEEGLKRTVEYWKTSVRNP